MEAETNYLSVWLVYLIAAAVFYAILHRVTHFKRPRWWGYATRAVYIALALTPWTANTQTGSFAPALMIMTLDAITAGGTAATRAMAPLLISLAVALLVASILYIVQKKRFNNSNIG